MKDHDYTKAGQTVTILPGAMEDLRRRGWHRGVDRNHDGESGTIRFEFGEESDDHHIAVDFGDETVGFAPAFVSGAVAPAPDSPTDEAHGQASAEKPFNGRGA